MHQPPSWGAPGVCPAGRPCRPQWPLAAGSVAASQRGRAALPGGGLWPSTLGYTVRGVTQGELGAPGCAGPGRVEHSAPGS